MFPFMWGFLTVALLLFGYSGFLQALEVKGWGSIDTIPHSYFNASTPNILRCGKLCEKQGRCAAATFDKRERLCFMHGVQTMIGLWINETNNRGRYLIKMYADNAQIHEAESTCNKETEIVVPSALYDNGTCYEILTPEAACQSHIGYQFHKKLGVCYKVEGTNLVVAKDAKFICESDGGHLVRIKNKEVNDFVVELVDITEYSSTNRIFIDGSDAETEGVWKFSNGETMIWNNWRPGEPESIEDEDCVEFFRPSDFLWVELSCIAAGKTGGYVCEIDV